MYVYSLFAKMILLDTIYSLKFLQSCFYSIVCTLEVFSLKWKHCLKMAWKSYFFKWKHSMWKLRANFKLGKLVFIICTHLANYIFVGKSYYQTIFWSVILVFILGDKSLTSTVISFTL